MKVMPTLTPFLKRCSGESYLRRRNARASVPIDIVVHDITVVLPGAAQERPRIEINNIVRKDKGEVLLLARAHELVFRAVGENVVANDIFSTVMLVKTGAFAPVNHVVFKKDVCAPFVGVESPPTIGVRPHVMNQIVAQDRSFLNSQCVNAAHVAEHALADVVKVIKLDNVVVAGSFLIAPVPSYGNRCVIKVMNMIVRDSILTALKNDQTDGGRINTAELVQVVVANDVAVVRFKRVLALRRLADADAARAYVVNSIPNDPATLATLSQFQGVSTEMRKDGIFNHTVHRAFSQDITAHVDGRLCVQVTVFGQTPVRVCKGQSLQNDVLHGFFRRKIPFDTQ